MSTHASPTPTPTQDSAAALVASVHDLVSGPFGDDAERLFELLSERYPVSSGDPDDDFPLLFETHWGGGARREIAWRLLGFLALRDHFHEAGVLAQRALTVFGLQDLGPRYADRIVAGVPEEVAHLPDRLLDAIAACLLPGTYEEELGFGPVSQPVGMSGLMSYAVARSALPLVCRGPGTGEEFVRRALGHRRWRDLYSTMQDRGLAERLASGLEVPDGPYARALVVVGADGRVPGVPEVLDWNAFAEDLQRTIVEDPDMCLAPPF